jgi:hypothetical protein
LTNVSLPSAFHLARYRLAIETLEPLELPPFKGSALRGGFGHTFKRLVCFSPGRTYGQPQQCGERCTLGNACPYGYVFETSPPNGSQALRNLQEVARPFVIQPPADRREYIPAGESLVFGLTLIGNGVNYLPYFIATFRELGRSGFGRTRSRYRLLAMDAVVTLTPSPSPGAGQLALAQGGRGPAAESVTIYRAEDEIIRAVNATIDVRAILERAAALPADRITLEFLTPARLKHNGRWVQGGPPFDALVKTLCGRISSLSYFHCGQPFEADFRGLIDRAAGVRVADSRTRWEDWARFSSRQQQRVEMGGLAGRITYAGDLRAYLPLLALGELVHVGKGTVFGNGQYRIVENAA